MSLFSKKNKPIPPVQPKPAPAAGTGALSEIALANIHDGVIITDKSGVIKFINPAAITMLDCHDESNAIGFDYALLMKIETVEGRELSDAENMLYQSMHSVQSLEGYQVCLVAGPTKKRIPVSISVIPTGSGHYIITFRNITKELAEEGEQTEFISTASHEMRTPVASIEGYLSLSLNPQTATIDDRARGYLTSAHDAAKHLGHLFQDLLDVTKLDDNRIRPKFHPVEMVGLVKQIADRFLPQASSAGLKYQFGAKAATGEHHMDQVVYGSVDVDFMQEIMNNLIENAIKYTPAGGSIYVNVHGDGDRVLINVTDTGIGISSDDIQHIFQKFYRADNSDTRTIGGTGLGLYLVKQRAEAMGGRVWAESAFGEGTTFFVSLPRITSEEYEKYLMANTNMLPILETASAPAEPASAPAPVAPMAAVPPASTPNPAPVSAPVAASPAPAQPAVPSSVPTPVPSITPAPSPHSSIHTTAMPVISQSTPAHPAPQPTSAQVLPLQPAPSTLASPTVPQNNQTTQGVI